MQPDVAVLRGSGLHGQVVPEQSMPTDHGVRVMFDVEAVELPNGGFKDREFITILLPGDMKSAPRRPLRDFDKARFKRQYEAWKKGQRMTPDGTPLSAVPWMTPAQVRQFSIYEIYTLEELSSVPDGALDNMGMGARKFRQMAIDWIDAMKGGDSFKRLTAQANEQQGEIASLKNQLEQLTAQLDAATRDKQLAIGEAYATSVLNTGAPNVPAPPQLNAVPRAQPSALEAGPADLKIASLPNQPLGEIEKPKASSRHRQTKKETSDE